MGGSYLCGGCQDYNEQAPAQGKEYVQCPVQSQRTLTLQGQVQDTLAHSRAELQLTGFTSLHPQLLTSSLSECPTLPPLQCCLLKVKSVLGSNVFGKTLGKGCFTWL